MFELLNFMHDLFLEGNVAVVNMLCKLLDGKMHGFSGTKPSSRSGNVLVGLFMKSGKLGICPSGSSMSNSE